MSLRHRLLFDGASMAQTALRRHGLVPKEKVMAQELRHLPIPNGTPMAQWRIGTSGRTGIRRSLPSLPMRFLTDPCGSVLYLPQLSAITPDNELSGP
jgi:hypothetical protein